MREDCCAARRDASCGGARPEYGRGGGGGGGARKRRGRDDQYCAVGVSRQGARTRAYDDASPGSVRRREGVLQWRTAGPVRRVLRGVKRSNAR